MIALPVLPDARRATRFSAPLVGAFVIGAIAYGGLYTFPSISVAFAADFGISRTLAVTPWTMFLIVSAIASPLLGRAYDEFADRDLLTASMVLMAAGWLAVYLAPDISFIILAYAALHAVGLQLAFVGISTAIARRYAGMSGLALGIAYAGPGFGVFVALPVAAGLVASAGWRAAALVFLAASLVGVAFVWLMTSGPAIVVPARGSGRGSGSRRGAGAAWAGSGSAASSVSSGSSAPSGSSVSSGSAVSSPLGARPALSTRSGRSIGEPVSYGQTMRSVESEVAARASGLHETAAPGAISAAQEVPPIGSGEHRGSIRRTVRTYRFWLLFAGAAAIGVFDEGVLQAFVPSAIRSGLNPGWAATALGFQSIAYVFGQVTGGWLSDRIGRRTVGVASAVLTGAGVIAALGLVATAPSLAVVGIVLHGIGTGSTIAVRSAAFSDVFGGANFGTIFGLLSVAYPLGGTVAVYVGAIALDRVGSSIALIPVVVAALVLWSGALWLAGPKKRRHLTPEALAA